MEEDDTRRTVPPTLCPSCRAPMEALSLEHAEGGLLTLDLCHACDGIWFDAGEQMRLTAQTTLALVTNMRDRHAAAARPGGIRLPCPRCGLYLGPTYDL